MTSQQFEPLLKDHPFFRDMQDAYIAELVGCASNERFRAKAKVFRQGEEANHFYIIREGRISIDIECAGNPSLTIQTLSDGDVLGWSWLFPPYLWSFDARAMADTRVVALDARCLRGKCEANPAMGYELMKRFSAIVVRRLEATRVQLLDMFAGGRA